MKQIHQYIVINISISNSTKKETKETHGKTFSWGSLKNSQMNGAERFIMKYCNAAQQSLIRKDSKLSKENSYGNHIYLIICSCMFSNKLNGFRRYSKKKAGNVIVLGFLNYQIYKQLCLILLQNKSIRKLLLRKWMKL